jgi:hypothetical protein
LDFGTVYILFCFRIQNLNRCYNMVSCENYTYYQYIFIRQLSAHIIVTFFKDLYVIVCIIVIGPPVVLPHAPPLDLHMDIVVLDGPKSSWILESVALCSSVQFRVCTRCRCDSFYRDTKLLVWRRTPHAGTHACAISSSHPCAIGYMPPPTSDQGHRVWGRHARCRQLHATSWPNDSSHVVHSNKSDQRKKKLCVN